MVRFQSPSSTPSPRYQGVAALQGVLPTGSADGTVHRIGIDPAGPDAHTIIATIQAVIEQSGRDPSVRAAAEAILRSPLDHDMERHARTIVRWTMDHMRYLPDPDGAEFIKMPVVLLDRIATAGFAYGDCDDHVVLLGSLLMSVGIPARAVAVKVNGADWYNHVVIEHLDRMGRTRLVDPCVKSGPTPTYSDRLVAG